MTSLRRLLKDYEESGALHTLLSVQAAIGDGVFVTKSGDLVTVLALRGRDYECMDAAEINQIARQFESVLRAFDERFRLYQYLLKREVPTFPAEHYANPVVDSAIAERRDFLASKSGTFYSLETYLVVAY